MIQRLTASQSPKTARGFTLLEMLLAMAILGAVFLVIASAISMMQNTWTKVRGKADGLRNTRMALDVVAGRLAQATLATRWATETAEDGKLVYKTASDLHFVSGPVNELLPQLTNAVGHAVFFQGPFGKDQQSKGSGAVTDKNLEDIAKLNGTLNAWGYFVEYGPDEHERPPFMNTPPDPERFPARKRFRLLEFRQPAQELSLFEMTSDQPRTLKINNAKSPDELFGWFRQALRPGLTYEERHVTVVAENVVAFIITPLDPKKRQANSDLSTPAPFADAPDSSWNSRGYALNSSTPEAQRHSLPPALQLTAIAISEDTWMRFSENAEDQQVMSRIATELQNRVNHLFRTGEALSRDIASITDYLDDKTQHPPIAIPYRIITILIPLAGQ